MMINGFINIDKPRGMTSFEVCEEIKKLLKDKGLEIRKAGHGGTLDPNVTGVLVIGINKAVRCFRFLQNDKEYNGVMHLHGEIDEKKLKQAMQEFVGRIRQLPPRRSRVKRKERIRQVFSFELMKKEGRDVMFRISCEAGTYIRKLVHDLGVKLRIGAHMKELRRIRHGKFLIDDAIALEELKKMKKGGIEKRIISIEKALSLPIVYVKKDVEEKLKHGMPVFWNFLEKKEKVSSKINAKFVLIMTKKPKKLIEIAKVINEKKIFAKPEVVLV